MEKIQIINTSNNREVITATLIDIEMRQKKYYYK